jgi:hypothetical protein
MIQLDFLDVQVFIQTSGRVDNDATPPADRLNYLNGVDDVRLDQRPLDRSSPFQLQQLCIDKILVVRQTRS